MSTPEAVARFLAIGENVHATRVLRRGGPSLTEVAGRPGILFTDRGGTSGFLPLPGPILNSSEYGSGRVKHVRAALLAGMAADGLLDAAVAGAPDPAAGEAAAAYLASIATRQVEAGAAYLDLNVDELAAEQEVRANAMSWLVRLLEPLVPVPLAIDSSSTAVLRAGVGAGTRRCGAPLINSASLERPDVLDLAAAEGCPVVASAVGAHGMPADARERIDNANEIVEAAVSRGIPLGRVFVDPLVLPAAVDPDAGRAYLDAVRSIRGTLGPAVHVTGGLSNVSFGLPQRRLLNEVFLGLAVEAGADSGIVDPVAIDVARAIADDRASEPARLAADLLLGVDPYGGEYLVAFREGRLDAAPAAR